MGMKQPSYNIIENTNELEGGGVARHREGGMFTTKIDLIKVILLGLIALFVDTLRDYYNRHLWLTVSISLQF